MRDIFFLKSNDGDIRLITPDIIRNTLIDCDSSINDFQIIQSDDCTITIHINEDVEMFIDAKIESAFMSLFNAHDLHEIELDIRRGVQISYQNKLRRVRRDWNPD